MSLLHFRRKQQILHTVVQGAQLCGNNWHICRETFSVYFGFLSTILELVCPTMYHLGKPTHGSPPFGPPPPRGPPFRPGGSCGIPPPGHLPPGPCGQFAPSAPDSHFLHNRPPRGHFISVRTQHANKASLAEQDI